MQVPIDRCGQQKRTRAMLHGPSFRRPRWRSSFARTTCSLRSQERQTVFRDYGWRGSCLIDLHARHPSDAETRAETRDRADPQTGVSTSSRPAGASAARSRPSTNAAPGSATFPAESATARAADSANAGGRSTARAPSFRRSDFGRQRSWRDRATLRKFAGVTDLGELVTPRGRRRACSGRPSRPA